MQTRGPFNALLRPGLRRDFRDDYMAWEEEWSKVVKSGTMDRAEIEMTTISGLPRQVPLGESEAFTIFDTQMADVVRKKDSEYGMGFSVSKNMMEDDLYKRANQSAKWLGRSVRLTQEHLVADFLDDAFTGTTYTGLFSEKLIDDDHALLGASGTWSNLIAGNPQLGVLGLQAAFELGESTKDQMGEPIPIKIDYLIINLKDEWMAIQLTQNGDQPFTTDRNINATRRKRQLSYTVNHYKDQTGKDWFARDSKNYDAHLDFKVRPQFTDWFDDSTRTAFFAARQRLCMYFYDQRGFVGSNAT